MNNKIPAFVFDVDDTLLDFTGGFRDYVNEYYDYGLEGLPEKYSFEGWLPCSMAFKRRIMDKFNKSWQFGCLQPLTGAVHHIDLIINLNRQLKQPLQVILLTKCGRDPATIALRKANLTHVFGKIFDDIIVINYEESKKHSLKKLQRTHEILLCVDDYVQNCRDMESLDIPVVVMRNSTNVNVTPRYMGLRVAEDWDQLYEVYIYPLLAGRQLNKETRIANLIDTKPPW